MSWRTPEGSAVWRTRRRAGLDAEKTSQHRCGTETHANASSPGPTTVARMLRGRPTATWLGHVRLGNHAAGMSSRAELRLARIGVNSEMLDRSRRRRATLHAHRVVQRQAFAGVSCDLLVGGRHGGNTRTRLHGF